MTEIVVTSHALSRAAERGSWTADRVTMALGGATHLGVSKDGLEVWRGGFGHGAMVFFLRAEGLYGCRPVRVAVVSVIEYRRVASDVVSTINGKIRRGWRKTPLIPDLWASRRSQN